MYIKFPGGTSTVLTLRCRFAKNAGKERRGNYSTEIPMIRKYTFGTPFPTDAVVVPMESQPGQLPYFTLNTDGKETLAALAVEQSVLNTLKKDDFAVNGGNGKPSLCYRMEKSDVVYGLGQNIRGINKRGWT